MKKRHQCLEIAKSYGVQQTSLLSYCLQPNTFKRFISTLERALRSPWVFEQTFIFSLALINITCLVHSSSETTFSGLQDTPLAKGRMKQPFYNISYFEGSKACIAMVNPKLVAEHLTSACPADTNNCKRYLRIAKRWNRIQVLLYSAWLSAFSSASYEVHHPRKQSQLSCDTPTFSFLFPLSHLH